MAQQSAAGRLRTHASARGCVPADWTYSCWLIRCCTRPTFQGECCAHTVQRFLMPPLLPPRTYRAATCVCTRACTPGRPGWRRTGPGPVGCNPLESVDGHGGGLSEWGGGPSLRVQSVAAGCARRARCQKYSFALWVLCLLCTPSRQPPDPYLEQLDVCVEQITLGDMDALGAQLMDQAQDACGDSGLSSKGAWIAKGRRSWTAQCRASGGGLSCPTQGAAAAARLEPHVHLQNPAAQHWPYTFGIACLMALGVWLRAGRRRCRSSSPSCRTRCWQRDACCSSP